MKNGKKSFQLTEEQVNAINQILIRCAIKIQTVIKLGPEKLSKKWMKLANSKRNTASTLLLLGAIDMEPEHLYTPDELNKKLANMQEPELVWNNSGLDDTNRGYLSDSQLTKALQPLVKGGLLINIQSKKKLKDFMKSQKRAGRERSRPMTGGRISLYKISPSIVNFKKLMSDVKIKNIVFNSLKNSGLLKKYAQVFLKAQVYLLTNDNFFNYLQITNRHLKSKKSDWEEGKKFFLSLNDKQIEKVADIIVNAIPTLENQKLFQPYYYLMYSLFEI